MLFQKQQLDYFLDYLSAQFTVRWEHLTPFYINDLPLGFLLPRYREAVLSGIASAVSCDDGVYWHTDWRCVGDILQALSGKWCELGLFGGWRDERFTAFTIQGKALFDLERSAFRPLGFISHAVHLNGKTERNGRLYYWIARRSAHKAVDPNKLDNLVGGGVSSGESIFSALVRESAEEAGLNHLQAAFQIARCCSAREVHRGVHREWLHIFDILLPDDFTPHNQDNEVACFELMNPQEIYEATINEQFMVDSALALMYSFQQDGLIDKTHPINLWLDAHLKPGAFGGVR